MVCILFSTMFARARCANEWLMWHYMVRIETLKKRPKLCTQNTQCQTLIHYLYVPLNWVYFVFLQLPLFLIIQILFLWDQALHKKSGNTGFHWTVDFVLIRDNTGQWKPVFSLFLCSESFKIINCFINFCTKTL